MSVEEWIDESNAIPPGEITLPSKEEIEKRIEVMTESQAAAIAIMQDLTEKRKAFKERLTVGPDVEELKPGEFLIKPVFFLRELEFCIKVIPIKRKLNRYSKQYIKKLIIKSRNLGEATDLNKE